MNRRMLLTSATLGALCALPVPSRAQAALPVYGLISLLADHLQVTGFESTTGTALNANPVERIELQTDDLERVALRALMRGVQASQRGKAVPLMVNDGKLYQAQDALVSGGTLQLPDSLRQTLAAQKATHLLLLTKHRAEARMRTRYESIGSGRVEGLGFYLDRVTPIKAVDSNRVLTGYLAPHVYANLWLIDLASNRVVKNRHIMESSVLVAGEEQGGADPWQWLDTAAKMKQLSALIDKGMEPAVRELLAP